MIPEPEMNQEEINALTKRKERVQYLVKRQKILRRLIENIPIKFKCINCGKWFSLKRRKSNARLCLECATAHVPSEQEFLRIYRMKRGAAEW